MEQLKRKIQLYKTYISYYVSQNSFKEIYILSILIAVYGGVISRVKMGVFSGFFASFSFPTFIISFFLINILNILLFNKFIDGNSLFYNIRINDKSMVLKEKIIMSVLLCLYFNFLFFLIMLPLIYLFNGGLIDKEKYYNYDINKFTYFLYSLIRLIIFNCIFAMLNAILYEKYKFKVVLIDFLFLLGIRLNSVKRNIRFSLNVYDILLFSQFKNFKYDVLSTLLIFVILFAFSRYLLVKIRKINSNVIPIVFSDFKFIINKKLNIFVLYLSMHTLIFILFRNINSGFENILGLNLDFNNFNLIDFLSFLLNDITYIFIFMKLLEKDMEYMYSVIFSRLKVSNWLLSKFISFFCIIGLLKLLDYFLFFVIMKVSVSLVFKYLWVELLNIMLIDVFILLVNLFKKNKILYCISIFAMIVLLPKNIMLLYNYKYLIIGTFIVINGILYGFSRFRNNMFFNLYGGSYDRNKKYC